MLIPQITLAISILAVLYKYISKLWGKIAIQLEDLDSD